MPLALEACLRLWTAREVLHLSLNVTVGPKFVVFMQKSSVSSSLLSMQR